MKAFVKQIKFTDKIQSKMLSWSSFVLVMYFAPKQNFYYLHDQSVSQIISNFSKISNIIEHNLINLMIRPTV